jgi:hypothetical protein
MKILISQNNYSIDYSTPILFVKTEHKSFSMKRLKSPNPVATKVVTAGAILTRHNQSKPISRLHNVVRGDQILPRGIEGP